jgi:hypothetical protein
LIETRFLLSAFRNRTDKWKELDSFRLNDSWLMTRDWKFHR